MRGNPHRPLAVKTRFIFQSTPLHKRQQASGKYSDDPELISIHASTWEATNFNGWHTWGNRFQFTPLHERRHRFQYTPSLQKIFQFTPLHERRRANDFHHAILHSILIHASTWEATQCICATKSEMQYFILASTWEATGGISALLSLMEISIHASAREAT